MAAGAHDYIETSAEPSEYTAELFSAKIASQIRIAAMQTLVQQQNAQIMDYHKHLMYEQQLAEEVFNKVSQNNGIDMANIRHWLSPIAVFNGDVLLAAPTPSGGLIVLLGDFTGHGLPAAIGTIPLASTFYSMVEKGFSMPDIIKELNAKLHAILPVSVFCCASVVQLNFDEGIVDIWNAGLPDSYVLRKDSSTIEAISSNGLALGIVGAGEYQPKPTRFNLLTGDRLYLLSDGVLEATNDKGEQFGDERLLEAISGQVNANPEKGFAAIKQQVIDFIGEHSRADDISLVELGMVNASDFAAMYKRTQKTITAEPVSWHFSYELRPDSLRYQDPVPLLLHLLMEVPTLRRYSGQLFTIITELYNNALEHGLLGLSSALKQAPEGFKSYYSARNDHLNELKQGTVCFTLDYQGDDKQGLLVVDVKDSGKGFNHAELASLAQPFNEGSHQTQAVLSGRGIPLLQSICSKIEYLGCGNHARVEFKWSV
jgi:serine phosphatase RsbU (regulator of sigma subunit)